MRTAQELIINLSWIIPSGLILYYVIVQLEMDTILCDKLIDHWDFYTSRMKIKGFILEELPSWNAWNDAAPCEVKFSITSSTVRVVGCAWKIYKIIKKIDKNLITIKQLEKISSWPSERLPL